MAVNLLSLPLIIPLPLSFAQAPSVHPVEFHKVSISTKLIVVLVIFPVVWICIPFTLVAGHFIEDAKVLFIFFRLELLNDRLNQIFLILCHLILSKQAQYLIRLSIRYELVLIIYLLWSLLG